EARAVVSSSPVLPNGIADELNDSDLQSLQSIPPVAIGGSGRGSFRSALAACPVTYPMTSAVQYSVARHSGPSLYSLSRRHAFHPGFRTRDSIIRVPTWVTRPEALDVEN